MFACETPRFVTEEIMWSSRQMIREMSTYWRFAKQTKAQPNQSSTKRARPVADARIVLRNGDIVVSRKFR